jgi:hypothetical protein
VGSSPGATRIDAAKRSRNSVGGSGTSDSRGDGVERFGGGCGVGRGGDEALPAGEAVGCGPVGGVIAGGRTGGAPPRGGSFGIAKPVSAPTGSRSICIGPRTPPGAGFGFTSSTG